MAKNDNLTDFLTDVADAIREKKGTTEKINPQDFSDEIRGIESGGSYNFEMEIIANDFYGPQNIRSIIIKEGVTRIESCALYNASNCVNVTMPSTITYIGSSAFQSCTKLSELILSPNIVTIDGYCFNGCTSLKKMNIPKGVERIQTYTFNNCKSLIFLKFITHESIPILENTIAFKNTTCKFVVPDALYDQWIVATNWATYANRIVKASEFVEPTN